MKQGHLACCGFVTDEAHVDKFCPMCAAPTPEFASKPLECTACLITFASRTHLACTHCGEPNHELMRMRDVALLREQLHAASKESCNHDHASLSFGPVLAIVFFAFIAAVTPLLLRRM